MGWLTIIFILLFGYCIGFSLESVAIGGVASTFLIVCIFYIAAISTQNDNLPGIEYSKEVNSVKSIEFKYSPNSKYVTISTDTGKSYDILIYKLIYDEKSLNNVVEKYTPKSTNLFGTDGFFKKSFRLYISSEVSQW